jgi:hypothetical protein
LTPGGEGAAVGLQRLGTLLAVLGLTIAALWAVVFGVTAGCTEIACPGATPTYRLAGVDLATATVRVSDGCNVCVVARPVVAGALSAVVGVVLGSAGMVRNGRI